MMEEVQEAMKEESNPMLAQLKQGEWVTPDLEDQLKSNSIFQKGLQNPKCVQAMQVNPLHRLCVDLLSACGSRTVLVFS